MKVASPTTIRAGDFKSTVSLQAPRKQENYMWVTEDSGEVKVINGQN